MNDETNDAKAKDERDITTEEAAATPELESRGPDASAVFSSLRRTDTPDWQSSSGPGRRWATIGCVIGIVLLIAALFAGSSLLRKTVWAGFAGSGQRLVAHLPGDLPPGQRMRLTRNLERFNALVKQQEDPYEAMGGFQKLVRAAFEDQQVSRDEVEQINLFLEQQLAAGGLDVPYSMP